MRNDRKRTQLSVFRESVGISKADWMEIEDQNSNCPAYFNGVGVELLVKPCEVLRFLSKNGFKFDKQKAGDLYHWGRPKNEN